MGTVRQMDSALQRRSNKSTTPGTKGARGGTAAMTDSEKIQLQLLLDVRAYGDELRALGVDPNANTAYGRWDDRRSTPVAVSTC